MEIENYSEAAQMRIAICEKITNIVRHKVGAGDQEWHIYTFRKDKNNTDSKNFKIHDTVSKKIVGIVPKKHLFSIFFKDDLKQLVVQFTKHCYFDNKDFDVEKIRELLPDGMNEWNIDILNK